MTDAPRELEQHLLRLPEFARVLTQGDDYVPLAKEEVEIIAGFTAKGERVVPMSHGIKDGDRVVITSGPLLGREGLIRSVDRRKSVAMVELSLCGRTLATRMGLAVLSGPNSAAAKKADLYQREALKHA